MNADVHDMRMQIGSIQARLDQLEAEYAASVDDIPEVPGQFWEDPVTQESATFNHPWKTATASVTSVGVDTGMIYRLAAWNVVTSGTVTGLSASSSIYYILLRVTLGSSFISDFVSNLASVPANTAVYDYYPVARVTTDVGGEISLVEQLAVADILPAFDRGHLRLAQSITPAGGWELVTDAAYAGRFPVFYKAGVGEYAVGCTGGYQWHGQTENNHQDHDLGHYHDLPVDPRNDYTDGIDSCIILPKYACIDCMYANVGAWCGSANLPTSEPPNASHMATHKGPGNGNEDTDNRPPFGALALWRKL